MKVYLTSDKIKQTVAEDEKFMNDIATIVKQHDHEVTVFLPVDPNSHITGMEAAPQEAFVFNIYGGADAGLIYEMGTDWFVKDRGQRNVMILFRDSAKDIRELDWLERAHDDDYSPASFTGLANPDQYLYEHGYGFDYVTDASAAAVTILNVVGRKEQEVVTGSDLSKTTGAVPLTVFQDMMTRHDNYKKNNGVEPDIIYIKSGGGDYVTDSCFEDMRKRYDAYKVNNGVEPSLVYFVAPTPARVVGPIQGRLEAVIGQFDNFTAFYNKSKGRGYKSYYNDVLLPEQEIQAYINKSGMNCTDGTQLFVMLAQEMGYQTKYVHVQCQSGGHVRMQIYGKEFTSWTRLDPAACMSVGSQYDIGQVWCDYSNAHIETDSWLLIDDGA
jgi:hypothetical protein